MQDNIFREYDIRGIVGKELIIDETYDLGKAIITLLKQEKPNFSTIVIGKDGRSHSRPICDNMIKAATDLGINVIDIGLVPTPVLYFASQFFKTPAAVIITASHNPKEYNGIKIHGIWGEKIQKIKSLFHEKNFYHNTSNKKGSIKTYDMIKDYIDFLANQFPHLKNKPLNAVIDCGNGCAGTVLPRLIEKMQWSKVTLLFPKVDGTFPNHEADPTIAKNMRFVKEELTQNQSLEIGLGFDGDCDRMNPMTKKGYLVPGDKMLALYAQKVLKKHPGATIVFDIKSSSSLIELLEQWKAHPVISPSGHSIIKEALVRNNALLAGELSCHFFFKDRYFGYDDGIYAALRLFEILGETDKTLDELLTIFPKKVNTQEIRLACNNESEKKEIVEHVKNIFAARTDVDIITIDGIRAQMNYGWGLVRASNTQMVISLRFESTSLQGHKQVKQDFYHALTPYFDNKKLRNALDEV